MLENKYGHFTPDGREFVITDPRTPRPWFNYIWNEQYVGLISHTGGGFSFLESPRDCRISRMRYNCLPWDRPGRYVMVKDKETGRYWSLSWAPTIDRYYHKYECHHGQGYTTIITEINDIRGEITYFVPHNVNAEIWRVSLKNLSNKEKNLEIYSFVELLMGNALNDLINEPNDKHFTDIHFDKEYSTLVATRRYWVLNKKVTVAQPNIDWKYKLYFSQTLPIGGFDSSLDKFIGRWRSEANPECVETGKMKNSEITAGDPIAALQSQIAIAPKGNVEFAVIMAVVPKDVANPYEFLHWNSITKMDVLDEKLSQLKKRWDNHLSTIHVETPEPKFDLMLNVWNQYQTAVTFDMARNSGYYHGGLLFGTGIRDQFQDILGVVMVYPDRVRGRLLRALSFQFKDGSTLHNFFKLTNWGEKTNHSDTPLWIPFGLVEYLDETGDFTILDEIVPYYDEGKATVYEHLVKSIDYAISGMSDRGMPKIMNGDWNDTLDHVGPKGKGETVWGAFFLAYNIRKTFELLEYRQDYETLKRWKKVYENLRTVTNEVAWDGEWYIRAFRDNGEPLGSHKHKQGKIFINSQTWSVISGLAPKERADQCLASVKKYLAKPNGIQICWPSYIEVEDNVGLISRCVPGKKENGAIFNHASSWFVLASLLNGDTDFAFDVYMRMNPCNSSNRIDLYEVEPYVYAEYITSPDHPTEGQASHSWLTGTAVWMLRIGLDYILGFRTSLKGVTIEPHIPSHWKEFRAERKFRGKTLKLHVQNLSGKNQGIQKMTINGTDIRPSDTIDVSQFTEETLNIEAQL